MDDTFREVVLSNAPQSLFKHLTERQAAIYNEARQMAYTTPLWEEPEAESVFPINRRAIFEGELRRAARALALPFQGCRHHGDNYSYVMVSAGILSITAHHVDRPRRFARPASSRKQNAAVNRLLLQPCLEEALLEPLPKIEGIINAHVLHGVIQERIAGEIHVQPFMTLAFPHPEKNKYVDAWDMMDVLQWYAERNFEASLTDSVVLPDTAVPKIKPESERTEPAATIEHDKAAESNA